MDTISNVERAISFIRGTVTKGFNNYNEGATRKNINNEKIQR